MLLELHQLSKRYGDKTVVDDVSVAVEEGTFVSLLGPSGSGKSTVLRMVAGLIAPDDGTIVIDGQRVSGDGRDVPPERRNIGMVFQDYALWPHMTVGQNIAFGLRLRRWSRARIRGRIEEMLELVRLESMTERYPFELSGGQQQRVALARALATDPRLILLDEPLSNLDMQLRQTLRAELVALLKRVGMTSLYVTHDYTEALEMSDSIVVLQDGRVAQQGAPDQLYEHPASLFVETFLGPSNLLPGRIEEHQGAVGIRSGQHWLQGRPTSVLNGSGVLCIRPEAVEIVERAAVAEVNLLETTLLHSGFVGNHWQHSCELSDGMRLQVTSPNALAALAGAEVTLRFPPDRCRILAPNHNHPTRKGQATPSR